jgi:hypothetical protein
VLHSFGGSGDGAFLETGVTLDSAGNIYGTASLGGTIQGCVFSFGCGIVFELSPNSDGTWTENVLHYFDGNPFTGGTDGAYPQTAPIFDSMGNLYGATNDGGSGFCGNGGCGMVYKLSPNGDGTWTSSSVHEFVVGPSDGSNPIGTIVFDSLGNLFGTTEYGAQGFGTAYELSPVGGTWTEKILTTFIINNGEYPSGLIIDSTGKLYGAASGGGGKNLGIIYSLVPAI